MSMNSGNHCDVHDTSHRSVITDFALHDWRLIAGGYNQGHDWIVHTRWGLCWHGPDEQFGAGQGVLESLVSRGVAYLITPSTNFREREHAQI